MAHQLSNTTRYRPIWFSYQEIIFIKKRSKCSEISTSTKHTAYSQTTLRLLEIVNIKLICYNISRIPTNLIEYRTFFYMSFRTDGTVCQSVWLVGHVTLWILSQHLVTSWLILHKRASLDANFLGGGQWLSLHFSFISLFGWSTYVDVNIHTPNTLLHQFF